MANIELLLEAERRGILPQEKAGLLAEARKRGLVPGGGNTPPPVSQRQAEDQSMAALKDMPQFERGSTAANVTDSVRQGMSLGFGDELGALENAALGRKQGAGIFDLFNYGDTTFNQRYGEALTAERAQNKDFRDRRPVTATTAEIAGAVLSPVNKLLPGMTAKTTAGKAAQGAAQGAGMGAVYGFGSGEGTQDRIEGAAYGAALGAPVGAVTGAAAGKLSNTRAKAPTTESLKAQSGAAYDAAEKSGVIIAKDSFRRMASDIRQKMADEGIDATMHPKAMAALNRLSGVDENVTLKGAEILRRVVKNAASSTDPSERRLAYIMSEKLDDFVGGMKPSDVLAGDAPAATKAMESARNLWARSRKAEVVEELVERARDQASGFENGLRIGARSLLQNKKKLRGFTPEEVNAIRNISRGGPINNFLRLAGKFGIDMGKNTNALGAALGAAAGGGAAGLPGAVALPILGTAARYGSKAMTSRNARLAGELLRQGGPLVSSRALTPIESRLAQALLSGGAVAPQIAFQPRMSFSTGR